MNPRDYKDAIKNITTRPSFKESNGKWREFVEADIEADKKAEKEYYKRLAKFGLEESSKPVIKNPVLRKALEPKKQFNNINDRRGVVKKPIKPAAKDKAQKKLDAIKASEKITTLREPDYFDYREAVKEDPRFPTLEQWMQTHAPITEDSPGITGLDKVKNFKRQVHLTNQKFPKVAKGIGPFLTGEDD